MYKLLKASFFRLKKNKVFWGVVIITIILAISFLVNSMKNEFKYKIDSILFNNIQIIGLFIAVFTSLFIGTEYAYGTIRNKIIAGHTRRSIYLTNWLVSVVAGILIEFIYLAVVAIIGIPLIGGIEIAVSDLLPILLEIIMVIIVFCSIFTAITLICSDMTLSTTICMLLFIMMFIVAGGLSTVITTKETIDTTYHDEDGTLYILESRPNPNYPNKMTRNICNFFYHVLPTGQMMEISGQINDLSGKTVDTNQNSKTSSVTTVMTYALGVILVVNGIGVFIFYKKELK